MANLKYFIPLLLLFVSARSYAVPDTSLQLHITKTIPGDFVDFYVDNLGNIYVITATNQVKKLDNSGDSAAVFNDVRRYGNIYSADVSNPLKILLYYRDFTTAVILDRFLNIRSSIDLRKADVLQAKAVAQSYDNNVWVFDEVDNKLKKVDETGTVLLESPDFRLIFNDAFAPSKIIDNNGQLYLYDIHAGWYLFDYYGAYKKKLVYTGWKDVEVADNRLTGHDSLNFYTAYPKDLQFNTFKTNIDLRTALKVQQQLTTVYVLSKAGLTLYQ